MVKAKQRTDKSRQKYRNSARFLVDELNKGNPVEVTAYFSKMMGNSIPPLTVAINKGFKLEDLAMVTYGKERGKDTTTTMYGPLAHFSSPKVPQGRAFLTTINTIKEAAASGPDKDTENAGSD